mgnify:CR=1 FL=1
MPFFNFSTYFKKPISLLQLIQFSKFFTYLILSIILVKSTFSPELIGKFEKFSFLSYTFTFFWINSFIQILFAIYNKLNFTEKKIFLFNFFLLLFLFTILFTLIIFVAEKEISKIFINEESIPFSHLFYIYFFLIPFSLSIDFILYVLNKKKALINFILLTSLLFIILLSCTFLKKNITYIIKALILFHLTRFIIFLYITFKNSLPHFRLNYLIKVTKLSLPLFLTFIISGHLMYIDGIIISKNFDNATFAIYRYGTRELPLSILFLVPFSNAMVSLLASSYNIKTTLKVFKYQIFRLMRITFMLSIVLTIISPFIFLVLYSKEFLLSSIIFNITLLLIIPRLLIFQPFLIAQNKTKEILISSVVELIIKILFAFLLTKLFGIIGLALSSFFSNFSEKFILYYYLKKFFSISFNEILPVKNYLIYSTLLIFSVLIVNFICYKFLKTLV